MLSSSDQRVAAMSAKVVDIESNEAPRPKHFDEYPFAERGIRWSKWVSGITKATTPHGLMIQNISVVFVKLLPSLQSAMILTVWSGGGLGSTPTIADIVATILSFIAFQVIWLPHVVAAGELFERPAAQAMLKHIEARAIESASRRAQAGENLSEIFQVSAGESTFECTHASLCARCFTAFALLARQRW